MKKILIVDDDDGVLEALENILTTEGYAVETDLTGAKLKQLRKPLLPDLILLDVLLSGTDGRDLCLALKSHTDTEQIPVLMLSAAPNIEQTIPACKANAFLAKPFDIDDLLKLVRKFTAG